MIHKTYPRGQGLLAFLFYGVSAAAAFGQQPAPSPTPGVPAVPVSAPVASAPRPGSLFDALDTNHDGVISAEEIAAAPTSLKLLLKNGSDHLTHGDLRPARGPHHPVADEANKPRGKADDLRPDGPRMRDRENAANEPAGRRLRRPMWERGHDHWASADLGRPHRRPEPMGERGHFARREDEDRGGERTPLRDERPGRHERPGRWEHGMDNDERPRFQHEFGGWRGSLAHTDDRMDCGERPRFWPERLSRHERPDWREGETDNGGRPRHRPEFANQDQESRAHRGPRPADARTEDRAQSRQPGAVHEQGGPGGERHGPPPQPLFDALDTNHDGTLSADEIANAPATLKALLKDGSDHLTRDDLRANLPPMPAH